MVPLCLSSGRLKNLLDVLFLFHTVSRLQTIFLAVLRIRILSSKKPVTSHRKITYYKNYSKYMKPILIKNYFVWINIFNIYLVVNHCLGNQKNSYKKIGIFSILGLIRISVSTKQIRSCIKMKRIRNTACNWKIFEPLFLTINKKNIPTRTCISWRHR